MVFSKRVSKVVFVLLLACVPLGNMFASTVQPAAKRLAVLPFEQRGMDEKDAGIIVSDLLLNELAKKDWYTVVERQSLQKVLDEQKLGLTGIIDDKTAAAIGNALGVQSLVLGSVSKLGNNMMISCRLVDSSNLKILKTASIKARNLEDLADKIPELSDQLKPAETIMMKDNNKNNDKPATVNSAYKTSVPLLNLLLPGIVQVQCSDLTGYFYMGGALAGLGFAITSDILYAQKKALIPGVHNGITSLSGYGLFAVLGVISTLHAAGMKSAALAYTTGGQDQFICSVLPTFDGAQLIIQGRF